jgi:hypothetical protein
VAIVEIADPGKVPGDTTSRGMIGFCCIPREPLAGNRELRDLAA